MNKVDLQEFCKIVGEIVKNAHDLKDGADLCHDLVEAGMINIAAGEDNAVSIVLLSTLFNLNIDLSS